MRPVFLELFTEKKPVIGVVHLKGTVLDNVMRHAKHEIEIYAKEGVDGILFDNQAGNYDQLEHVLSYVKGLNLACIVGVQVLHVDALSFHLANKFSLDFVQVDGLAGQGNPREEYSMHVFFNLYRENCQAKVIGDVRAMQHSSTSKRTMEEDLDIAMKRCDGITVREQKGSGEAVGEKLAWFRSKVSPFPVILRDASAENVMKYIHLWDAVIMDSAFKEQAKPMGSISESDVRNMMQQVRAYREVSE